MKGGGQQQTSSPELTFFFLVAIIAAVIIGGWYYHKVTIVTYIYSIRAFELSIVYGILDVFYDFFVMIDVPVPSPQFIDQLRYRLFAQDFSAITPQGFRNGLVATGWVIVYPATIFALGFCVYLAFFKSLSRVQATYSMRTFSNLESVNWPLISPVLDKNLVKEDIEEGPWRMADNPIQFAERHDMVKSVYQDGKNIARLDKSKAHVVFAMQLGPLWNGIEPLPAYIRALFAIFAAKAENDSKGARVLLDQIASSSKSGKLNFGGTQELLVKHIRSPKIGRAAGPHAYLLTVMASMLELARTDGVLATSEFLWLKPLDRRLWYMLSCVGRQTPFTEISGAFGHWIIEKRLRRPLKVPMVAEAVNALDTSLAEIIYNPEK
tara:strand:+ start:107 stop:1243 length:1137 start_codon:yes stop_codon:yes gene_type:complete